MAQASPLSFRGRLGQADYWKLVGGLMAVRVVAAVTVAFNPQWARHLGALDFLLVFVAAAVGRRLRDFGWRPIWGWVAVFVLAFAFPMIVAVSAPPPPPGGTLLDTIPAWAGWANFVLLAGLLVIVGRQPGDPGPNRYGAPPEPIFKRGS